MKIYLLKKHVDIIQKAQAKGDERVSLNIDLGYTKKKVSLLLSDFDGLPLDKIKSKNVYVLNNGEIHQLAMFHDNNYYKLAVHYGEMPTVEISGMRMHMVKHESDLDKFSKRVINHLLISGSDLVLDTCMGLGYSAMKSSEKAKRVITCERSTAVYELAKENPYSTKLFDNKKIEIVIEPIQDYLKRTDEKFNVIVHDPPSFKMDSYLYSSEFNELLLSKAAPDCKLYHYTGRPFSRNRPKKIVENLIKRLELLGWKNVEYDDEILGITANL